jgi:hypothetical protein
MLKDNEAFFFGQTYHENNENRTLWITVGTILTNGPVTPTPSSSSSTQYTKP